MVWHRVALRSMAKHGFFKENAMLILTRKTGQSIRIGNDITVTVTSVDTRGGPTVRIGISAPKEMLVDREEIRERRDREKASA